MISLHKFSFAVIVGLLTLIVLPWWQHQGLNLETKETSNSTRKLLIKYFSEITTSLFVSISAVFSIILFWNGIQNNTYGNFIIFEWISSGNFVVTA